jgi:hypothetical protein
MILSLAIPHVSFPQVLARLRAMHLIAYGCVPGVDNVKIACLVFERERLTHSGRCARTDHLLTGATPRDTNLDRASIGQ